MAKLRKPVFSIEELKKVFSYNPETGNLTRLISTRTDFLGEKFGNSLRISYKNYSFMKTQLIWALYYGYWSDKLIDHRDGDNRNNKIANLREATYRQNQFNKIGFGKYPKGVVFKKDTKRSKPWAARIRINGRKIPLGSFATMEEAAECYKKAAEKYQGEFALHKSMKI